MGEPMSYKWVKKWKVESSSAWKYNRMARATGTKPKIPTYVVSLSVDGEWGCSCKGWVNRHKDCRHIDQVKRDIKWNKDDLANLIELQALRITQLREKGKSEKEIEKDMETLVWE